MRLYCCCRKPHVSLKTPEGPEWINGCQVNYPIVSAPESDGNKQGEFNDNINKYCTDAAAFARIFSKGDNNIFPLPHRNKAGKSEKNEKYAGKEKPD